MPQVLLNSRTPTTSSRRTGIIEAPTPLRLWHLASLDAPTVALVWSLAFAWDARVRLPIWVPALLALAVFTIYVADRLLDVRVGLRAPGSLRERHFFHWRHRRILLTLAVAAASTAAWIVFNLMPTGARERDSVLAAASLVYFTRVHTGRRFSLPVSRFLSKELLVGLLFTAGCAIPAWTRADASHFTLFWPLLVPVSFFALLAWLNCHAIDRWEASIAHYKEKNSITVEGTGHCLEGTGFSMKGTRFSVKGTGFRMKGTGFGVKGTGFSLKGTGFRMKGTGFRMKGTGFGVKGTGFSLKGTGFRMKGTGFRMKGTGFGVKGTGFSPYKILLKTARALAPEECISEISLRTSSFREASLVALIGLILAAILCPTQPRSAALLICGVASALLLSLLDIFRSRLTPIALRTAADLVLLTPLLLIPVAPLFK